MKLVKLSLIAAMATTGIMATTASAAPLDEVIKDVDVSGFARMRYTHDKNKLIDGYKIKEGQSNWNFRSELFLKTKIDDNFFYVAGLRFNDTDAGQNNTTYKDGVATKTDRSGVDANGFVVHRAYLGYNIGNTVVQVGRQDVGAFFTADMYGNGIKVLNSDIEGLTLAALWMDALEKDSDIGTLGIKDSKNKEVTDHNLYGVAALGSYDPVSFQVWYAILEDVTDLFAVELAASFDVSDDVNLNAKLQYGFSDFDSSFKKDAGVGDADFYGIELGTKLFGADLSAGYVDFSTDKDKTSLVSFEDSGSFIKPGEELFDYTVFDGKNHYWFVTAGYTIPDTGLRIGADYLDGKNKVVDEKTDMKEVVGRIEYAHSDKLKFKTWYSHVKEGDDNKKDRVRFEAKYSF